MDTVCDIAAAFECFNKEGLAAILPHRGNALRKIDGVFLDRGNLSKISGVKEITADDPDLDGHFPGAPTYPGYAQDEFACLTAAALIFYTANGSERNPHVVQKTVKYKKSVVPGDRLLAEVTLTGKKKRFFLFTAEIRNQHDELVAEYERIVGVV